MTNTSNTEKDCGKTAGLTTSMGRTFIACTLMVATFCFITFKGSGQDVPILKPLATFPKVIGKWQGDVRYFDQKVYDVLGVDDSSLIAYKDPDGREVELYVGYYTSQRKGDIIHSPKNCLPGAGWRMSDVSTVPLHLADGREIRIARLDLEKGLYRMIAYYWYQSRGRFINSEYFQKIYLVIDSLSRNRTDGAFVRLLAPARNGDVKSAEKALLSFAETAIPILEEYLPGSKLDIGRASGEPDHRAVAAEQSGKNEQMVR